MRMLRKWKRDFDGFECGFHGMSVMLIWRGCRLTEWRIDTIEHITEQSTRGPQVAVAVQRLLAFRARSRRYFWRGSFKCGELKVGELYSPSTKPGWNDSAVLHGFRLGIPDLASCHFRLGSTLHEISISVDPGACQNKSCRPHKMKTRFRIQLRGQTTKVHWRIRENEESYLLPLIHSSRWPFASRKV